MAKKTSDLRGTLGAFLKTAVDQASTVGKIALDRVGQERERVDDLLLKRKYQHVMAQLGRLAFQLSQDGVLPELERNARGLELLGEALEIRSQLEDEPEAPEWEPLSSQGQPQAVWRPTKDTPAYSKSDEAEDADLEEYMHPDDVK